MEKNKFEVFSIEYQNEEDLKENGGFKHIIKNKNLYIFKDGVSVMLTDDEIMEMLKALGVATKDFRKGY